MGTISLNTLQSANPAPLSGNLSGVSTALAQAANALLAVANALKGEGVFAPTSPALATTQDPSPTVGEAVNEFLRAKARAGRSDRYLRALRVSLCSFARGRYSSPLAAITVADFESWLEENNWSPRTQRGYLSDVRTLYNFAVRRGLVSHNPANAVELPPVVEKPPCIHTPAQVRAALEFAQAFDLNLCRALAIRYFAGLRSIEIERSREENIHAQHIEITAANAKQVRGRRRRIVTISPNLRAWLDLGGTIDFGNGGNRWAEFNHAFTAKTKIEFPDNVTRHTFVSYHLARSQNAGKTALEAGHTEQMLFSNYRETVTSEAASEFWEICPR